MGLPAPKEKTRRLVVLFASFCIQLVTNRRLCRVVTASALYSADVISVPLSIHIKDFKNDTYKLSDQC